MMFLKRRELMEPSRVWHQWHPSWLPLMTMPTRQLTLIISSPLLFILLPDVYVCSSSRKAYISAHLLQFKNIFQDKPLPSGALKQILTDHLIHTQSGVDLRQMRLDIPGSAGGIPFAKSIDASVP